MNETKYLWITNIPSKCKVEDVSRVLRRHGDIKTTKTVHHNSCVNLIVEYLDRSSAVRAVRSQNLLKGNTLKVDYCDSFGNPWISSSNRSLSPTTINQSFARKSSGSMLVDRAGPSSGPSGHHHHHHTTTSQTPQSTPQHHSHQRGFHSPLSSSNISSSGSSNSSNSRPTLPSSSAVPSSTSLKVIFTPPPKYAETQIKQALCHELHKFGKTYHVNLLPASITGGRQTRVALVVFRRAEDEEKAFLAFRNEARGLFGAPVHAEFCLGNNHDVSGSSLRLNRPPLASSNTPIHSATTASFPLNNHHLTSSTSNPTSQQRTIRNSSSSSTFSLPTRSLVVHGLTAGPNGPVSEVQLNTAFQRFGAILHVQMRPASSSAVIEFVELRGSTRAMTTHQRDPLRLGGRPLRLFYTPSRLINCLFINDLPSSLAYQSEIDLKSLFSRVVPVTRVLKITRSQEASVNHSTTVHTCALVELTTHELATQLLDYLRSSDSPLAVATQNRSSPDPITTPRLPTFVCSVDYASPRQMDKIIPLKLKTSQTVISQSQPPSLSSMANDKSRGSISMSKTKGHSRLESSEEDHSQSSSTSNSSFTSSKRSTTAAAETFPSQRREAPSYFSRKRLFPDPAENTEAVVNRNHGGGFNSQEESSNAFESMYDKIKRRTEGEKERRKRGASPELDDPSEISRKKKKRRKQHCETTLGDNDDIFNEGTNVNNKKTEEEMSKLRHKLKHSKSPSSKMHGKNRSKNTSSRSSVESHRQKSRTTAQPPPSQTKPVATTITRLSLGMSVPMTANYHAIAKTPKRMSRLSESESSSSSMSRSGSVSPSLDDMVDVKHHFSNRRASGKSSVRLAFGNSSKTTAGKDINRSLSLNDVESASGYLSPASSFFQKRLKRRKEHIKPSTPSPNVFNKKSEKRKMSSNLFKSSRASSSSPSTEDEGATGCRKYGSKALSNSISRSGSMAPNSNSNNVKRNKSKRTKDSKPKSKRTQSPVMSDSSSRSASSLGSPFKRRGNMEDTCEVNASTPLSLHGRLPSKLTPPSRNSDFHTALSDDDSLDDFDRISANTVMTPSTEAMEISPDTGDEEPEHSVSEWFSRLSDNHSESEMEPEKEYEEDVRCVVDDQKSLLMNFDDLNIINTSKEDNLNLSNRDAIGDIKMEDQPSPRLNESSDKSKSTHEENSDTKASSELTSSDEVSVKPQLTSTPPKFDPGTLPPPKLQNVQQISSPYSSSSPTQSLCSACSRSSPSPVITAPVFTSRCGMIATNTVTETTTHMRTLISATQEGVKPSATHPGISENRDLKRYVQSVIERVKAETVDDTNPSIHKSANTTSANTPITSPLHHSLPAASPPHNPQSTISLPPPPPSTQQIGKKGTSPGAANNRRTSAATPPSLISNSSSPTNSRKMFEASAVPSIPGVNACAPLLLVDIPTSTSPKSKPPPPPPQMHEPAGVEPKALRSTTRRRAKTSTAAAASTTVNVAPIVEPPKQPTDPYEPNFDDDSPPRVKSGGSSSSPLIVNTLLPTEHPGPASTISSVTTNEEGPPLPSTTGNEAAITKTSNAVDTSRKAVMDSVDETIADVCSGRFDMKSYLENWGLQPPTTTTAPDTSSQVAISNSALSPKLSKPVSMTSVVTTTASAMKPTSDASKQPIASATTNNPIVTAIINALQSITGSPVMIGTSGANNTAGAVRQSNSAAAGQQIPAKPSNVVVGSSPPTISATTITFPVIIKNFSAANTTPKTVPAPIIKSSVANSQPVTMTTESTSVPQQPPPIPHQSPQQHQVNTSVAMSRPHSSSTDTLVESSHPYRVRRGSDNNIGPPPQVDDMATQQQRPLFNNPRCGFTSPPPPQPRCHHQFATPPPAAPTPRHVSSWNRAAPGSFPRPETSSSAATTSPNPAYPPPPTAAALVEKLSHLIDRPDLVPLMLQTMMQEGQHLDPEWLGSVLKMFQQYSSCGGGDNGLPGQHPGGITNNTNPSPVQQPPPPSVSSNHPSRATPPFQRSGGSDQTYPLVWQGRLSLKNSEVSVALHYVQGNTDLLRACISTLAAGGGGTPQQALITSGGPLRIVQRMRLEASQLDAVQRKIGQEGAACACVAFASGVNRADLVQQNVVLEEGFIRYMLEKGAAGIINVGQPGSVQGLYVVHIFPPCDFSHAILRLAAPDLHQSIISGQFPHLLIVITTV